jgi:hypothetical protein
MNKDTAFIFEAYKASSTHGTPIFTNPTGAPGPKPGYDALQNAINKKTDPMSRIEQKRKGRINIGSVRSEDAESSPLVKAMHTCATELDRGAECLGAVVNVSQRFDVDPIELAQELKSAGVIGDEDLHDVVEYTKSSHSEDAESTEYSCKYAAEGCDCGECEECQDNAMSA